MEPKQRKLRNNLLISGAALVGVVLVDAIKLVLYWILDPTLIHMLEMILAEYGIPMWSYIAVLAVITVLELAIGFYIGFSARAEGKGKKRNIFYVIIAIIMAALLAIGCAATIIQPFLSQIDALSVIDAVVSAALSVVVVYVLVDIVVSSLKNRKLNKENKKRAKKDEEVQK